MNNIIDEIKKNIEQEAYNENFYTKIVQLEDVFKILEKYQDQEDVYKKMWEKLYAKNLLLKIPNMKLLQLEMEEMEKSFVQKHNIKEVE